MDPMTDSKGSSPQNSLLEDLSKKYQKSTGQWDNYMSMYMPMSICLSLSISIAIPIYLYLPANMYIVS